MLIGVGYINTILLVFILPCPQNTKQVKNCNFDLDLKLTDKLRFYLFLSTILITF